MDNSTAVSKLSQLFKLLLLHIFFLIIIFKMYIYPLEYVCVCVWGEPTINPTQQYLLTSKSLLGEFILISVHSGLMGCLQVFVLFSLFVF